MGGADKRIEVDAKLGGEGVEGSADAGIRKRGSGFEGKREREAAGPEARADHEGEVREGG